VIQTPSIYSSLTDDTGFWPNAQPVTVDNFNWAPVMFIAVVVVALITYFVQGRKVYSGPVVIVEGRREESLTT
jgi:choline transport protein